MLKNIEYFLYSAIAMLADEGEINAAPIKEWILGKITPILGIFAFAVVICVGIYIAGFWIGYAVADEDGKQEKMEKWKKNIKGLVIALIICTSLGTLLVALGAMFGVSINL